MNVLGFNNFASHDPSASIVTDRNGTLEYVAIAEERLCRVKKSHYSPLRSIRYCMDHFGIKDFSEVDLIVVDYVFHKQLTDTANHYRKLEHDYIKTKLKLDYNKLLYIDSHHMAHAASAYYPSNFKEAAILIVDGFGSNVETNSLFVGNSQGIRLIEQAHGIGIGLVYEVVTSEILGFARGQEGKTMGLAALGRDIKGDAILHLQPVYKGMVTDFSHFIDRAPREMLKQAIPACPQPSEVTNDFYSKIAFEVQEEAERCMVHLANYAYEKTGMKNLCIAGGVGLNCLANSAIIDQTPFENVFIQPASSDVGLSLGLALHGYSRQSTQTFSFNVYTGKNYAASETETLLQKFNIPYKQIEIPKVAQLISEGNIVGWFVGRSEFGPRALGHRSILADPRKPDMKDIVNARVKHREMFRPFAPSILAEHAQEYFKMSTDSSFMLLAPDTQPDKKDVIPSVIHVDGLARVQTVHADNTEYYTLIQSFYELTDVPVLLNTSFNDNEEPVVETPEDALLCVLKTEIDYLYLNGLLIQKSEINNIESKLQKLNSYRTDKLQADYKKAIQSLCPEYSVDEMLSFLKHHLPGHHYYNHLHTSVLLRQFIHHHIKPDKKTVTDTYHKDLLQTYMPEEFALIQPGLILLEDTYNHLEQIPENAAVILFNLSLYLKNKKVHNFYADKSLLKLRAPEYHQPSQTEINSQLEQSLEYTTQKNWDSFYQEKVLQT